MQQRDFLIALEIESNRQIDYVLSYIQNMGDDFLAKKIRKGTWSIVQNLSHLNEWMKYYLPVIQQKLSQCESDIRKNVFLPSGEDGLRMILAVHPLNGEKHKTELFFSPSEFGKVHQVLYSFMNLEEHLLMLIRKAACANINDTCRPFTGRNSALLNIGELFAVIVLHNTRHLLQIESIRRKLMQDKFTAYSFGAEDDFVLYK